MKKKLAVVTGGSSGIGLAVAKLLISQGFRVCNLDKSTSAVGEFYACDVQDHLKVRRTIEIIAAIQTIDVLVINAGMHFSANIEDTTEDALMRVFNLNVKGAYSAVQATLPSMKAAKNGSIIIISSDQALIAKRNSFAYNMSKAALASMAKTTALDYAAYNIRANAVCPGTIETPLYHKAIDAYCARSGADKAQVHAQEAQLQPLGRIGQADEVAALVAFLASDNSQFITGSLQVIDGGYTTQ